MNVKTPKRPPEKNSKQQKPQFDWTYGPLEICDFFNISEVSLLNWRKKGLPQEERGKYDLKKIIQWKFGENGEENAAARKLKAEADWKESKAGQEAIKLAVAEGKYISTEHVSADLRRLFTVLRKSLLSIGHNVAIEINTLEPEIALVAKRKIDDAISEALKQLSESADRQTQ